MSETVKCENKGIDYGLGQNNRSTQTGIRFGVIPQNALNPDTAEDIWRDGEDLDFQDFREQVLAELQAACEKVMDNYLFGSKVHESGKCAGQAAFESIEEDLGDCYETNGDCARVRYESHGLTVKTDSSGDVWVFKSPYFTYAQFCSPCAPGACYLTNALETPDENNKAYCFGHDWFEDDKAPYPVYSVETGELVQPKNT